MKYFGIKNRKNALLLLTIFLIAFALRFLGIDKVPVSLSQDELDVGYQAYSLSQTGKDYFGNGYPLHIQSVHEWRTPVAVYLTVPTVALFGTTPLGIRLTSMVLGSISVLFMFLLVRQLGKFHKLPFESDKLGLISAFLLAISPWHIQYSRLGFDMATLVFLLIFGLYLFFRGLDGRPKLVALSLFVILLMPWTYSTAKVYTPLLVVTLIALYFRRIVKLPRKVKTYSILIGMVMVLPLLQISLKGVGTERIEKISIFLSQQELENKLGDSLLLIDPKHRSVFSRIFYNKFTFYGDRIIENYSQALSPDFLFVKGDPNLRHSIDGMGMFYLVDVVPLVLGAFVVSNKKINNRLKILTLFMIVGGIFPSSLTIDGGTHASRLVLIVFPLIFLITIGVLTLARRLKILYIFGLLACFISYQHNFWLVNPAKSEMWWDTGWEDAVRKVNEIERNYDKVVIDVSDVYESVMFASYSKLDPKLWHESMYGKASAKLNDFGSFNVVDKFYFGSLENNQGYVWLNHLDEKTLVLAKSKNAAELSTELKVVDTIYSPSGKKIFYLLDGS